jgi:hypothetical protein
MDMESETAFNVKDSRSSFLVAKAAGGMKVITYPQCVELYLHFSIDIHGVVLRDRENLM